jgi:hypothetical protein
VDKLKKYSDTGILIMCLLFSILKDSGIMTILQKFTPPEKKKHNQDMCCHLKVSDDSVEARISRENHRTNRYL